MVQKVNCLHVRIVKKKKKEKRKKERKEKKKQTKKKTNKQNKTKSFLRENNIKKDYSTAHGIEGRPGLLPEKCCYNNYFRNNGCSIIPHSFISV